MMYRIYSMLLITFTGLMAFNTLANPHFSQEKAQQAFLERKTWLVDNQVLSESQTPAFINSLILADSPYLLSHALQPILWHEWQDDLAQLPSKDKLIFVSIGYSTCHWCHVMAEESFADLDVATILNQHYVSIKVDREQLPLVDHRFKSALEAIKGEAGWPINAIMTPDGKIVWIESYLNKMAFSRVLTGLAKRWQSKPASVSQLANRIEAKLQAEAYQGDLSQQDVITQAQWRELLPQQHQIITQLLQEQQSAAPRFLKANWLIGQLEQYLRSGDIKLLNAVERQVEQILLSPTYDAIDGGFHRYAVDNAWLQPHFEKMLYTQANMLTVLAKLYAITDKPAYLAAIAQTNQWVQTWLHQESGYASAVSALTNGVEGQYYLFSKHTLANASPSLAYVDWQASATRLAYLATLKGDWNSSEAVKRLQTYRQLQQRPLIDEKVLLSWNSMYALSLLDVYAVTLDSSYLTQAESLLNKLWGVFKRDNRLYRSLFLGRTNTAAQAEDYAWFALAQLHLSFYQDWSLAATESMSAKYRAKWLLDQLVQQLADTQVYQSVASLERDDETEAVKSVVYRAFSTGYQQISERSYRILAKKLQMYDRGQLAKLPNQYRFVAQQSARLNNVAYASHFFAKGNGKVSALVNENGISLVFNMAPGWHINANKVSEKRYIATDVSVETLSGEPVEVDIQFPEYQSKALGFDPKPLYLFEQAFNVTLESNLQEIGLKRILISLQACSERLCLLPEKLQVAVSF